MDHHDVFWDEDLTSDLEWTFVDPVPKAPSMSPVCPHAPPQPVVTVQDLQKGKLMPAFDRSVPDFFFLTGCGGSLGYRQSITERETTT